MKNPLHFSIWIGIACVFSIAFIGWSVLLVISADRDQEKVAQHVHLVSKMEKLEEAVAMAGYQLSEKPTKSHVDSLFAVTDTIMQSFSGNPLFGSFVGDMRVSLAKMDSLYDLNGYDERNSFNHHLIYAEENKCILTIKKAKAGLRRDLGIISEGLAWKWKQLHFLVAVACLSVIAVVTLLVVSSRNINKRLAVESEKEATRMFLDAILENIPDMIFVKDAKELRFVRFNKAGEELIGKKREDLLGRNDYDFFPKEQADFFTSKDREVLSTGKVLHIAEEQMDTSALGKRWLHTRKVPLLFKDGEAQYLLGIAQDITESKKRQELILQMNEELEMKVETRTKALAKLNEELVHTIDEQNKAKAIIREAQNRYLNLINTIKEGILYVDDNGIVLFVNKQFCEMLGYDGEELIGKNAFSLQLLPAKNDGSKNLPDEAVEEDNEIAFKTKSGEERLLQMAIVPVKDDKGNIIGSLGTYLDITHIRRTEKLLGDKNRELDMFFYRSSHDLKGPLASMQGLLNLARSEINDPLARLYFEKLSQSSERLDKILLGLIDVLSVTRGSIAHVEFDPKQLVNEVIDGFRYFPVFAEVKINVNIVFDEKITFDKTMFRSILQNLLHNAINYRRKTELAYVNIFIRKDGDTLLLSVEDNGVGIPPEMQEKIFAVFFRANNDSPGSGLGLYIVKTALNKVGGTIELKSTIGIGSTFSVRLPLSQK